MKSTEILHVFGPQFFWGGGELPEFLESIYKIDTGSDHVAKFRGTTIPGGLKSRVFWIFKKT